MIPVRSGRFKLFILLALTERTIDSRTRTPFRRTTCLQQKIKESISSFLLESCLRRKISTTRRCPRDGRERCRPSFPALSPNESRCVKSHRLQMRDFWCGLHPLQGVHSESRMIPPRPARLRQLQHQSCRQWSFGTRLAHIHCVLQNLFSRLRNCTPNRVEYRDMGRSYAIGCTTVISLSWQDHWLRINSIRLVACWLDWERRKQTDPISRIVVRCGACGSSGSMLSSAGSFSDCTCMGRAIHDLDFGEATSRVKSHSIPGTERYTRASISAIHGGGKTLDRHSKRGIDG